MIAMGSGRTRAIQRAAAAAEDCLTAAPGAPDVIAREHHRAFRLDARGHLNNGRLALADAFRGPYPDGALTGGWQDFFGSPNNFRKPPGS